jgi:ABC-type spermidine/putrescine transport system permease subunit II
MDGFGQMMRLIPGGPTTAIVLALIFLVTCVVLAIAFYKLYQKAGLSGPIGLLAIVPVVNMGIALYLAFAEWPLAKELAHAKLLAASVATPAVEAVGPTTPLVESAQPAEA